MLMPCPKRFRPITSKPKIAARDRMLAVGVEGRELFPVENLNNPYWWTVSGDNGERKLLCSKYP